MDEDRPDPKNYVKNGSRAELASLGEGSMITVTAKALSPGKEAPNPAIADLRTEGH